MNFVGKAETRGNLILIQTTPDPQLPDGIYNIEMSEYGKNRSNRQNNMLWGLISEISKKLYGDLSEKDTIYRQLLEMSGAKYTIVTLPQEDFDDGALTKFGIRAYREIARETNSKGKTFVSAIIFYGSSTFTTKEMNQLIETTIRYASECGIDVDKGFWEEVLNGC